MLLKYGEYSFKYYSFAVLHLYKNTLQYIQYVEYNMLDT